MNFREMTMAGAVLLGSIAGPAWADDPARRQDLIKKLDMMDKLEVMDLVEAAKACSRREDFSCARGKLKEAGRHVVDSEDRGMIASATTIVDRDVSEAQRRQAEEEARKRAEAERANAATQRRQVTCRTDQSSSGSNNYLVHCTYIGSFGINYSGGFTISRGSFSSSIYAHCITGASVSFSGDVSSGVLWVKENCGPGN